MDILPLVAPIMPAISLPPLSGGNAYYPSGRDEYAQNILLTALYEDSNDSGGTIDIGYPPPPTPSGAPRGPTEPEYSLPAPTPSGARGASNRQRIGIIGAGAAGLYTALLLDSLGDIGFDYDILEADPERIGGRLYTHWFDDKEKKPNEYFVRTRAAVRWDVADRRFRTSVPCGSRISPSWTERSSSSSTSG
jgi:hypothetical protein